MVEASRAVFVDEAVRTLVSVNLDQAIAALSRPLPGERELQAIAAPDRPHGKRYLRVSLPRPA